MYVFFLFVSFQNGLFNWTLLAAKNPHLNRCRRRLLRGDLIEELVPQDRHAGGVVRHRAAGVHGEAAAPGEWPVWMTCWKSFEKPIEPDT